MLEILRCWLSGRSSYSPRDSRRLRVITCASIKRADGGAGRSCAASHDIELMPSISIHEFRHAIPRYHGPRRQPEISRSRLLAAYRVHAGRRTGHVQRFRIVWIRTGLGTNRAILVCSCGRGAIRLFARYGAYACKALSPRGPDVPAAEQSGPQTSPGLQAAAGSRRGLPDVNETIAPRATGKHRRAYQRLRGQVQALEKAIGSRRFRRPLDMRVFAYHVG